MASETAHLHNSAVWVGREAKSLFPSALQICIPEKFLFIQSIGMPQQCFRNNSNLTEMRKTSEMSEWSSRSGTQLRWAKSPSWDLLDFLLPPHFSYFESRVKLCPSLSSRSSGIGRASSEPCTQSTFSGFEM